MSSNPLFRTAEDKRSLFKSALLNSVSEHIPQKYIKSCRDLPWINHEIKNSMLCRRQLYNIAKQSGKSEDWTAYHLARYSINTQLECAHNAYYGRLFDVSLLVIASNSENTSKLDAKNLLAFQLYLLTIVYI